MMKIKRIPAVVAIVLFFLHPAVSRADGIIVPPPGPRPKPVNIGEVYSVKYHHVRVDVEGQVATTTVDQAFVNETGGQLEVEYVFPLPRDAQVKKFALFVGDKELPGKILDREEARRIYEKIVRSHRDPALLEYIGNGMFKSSVFPIPTGQQRRVKLVYSQLLSKEGDRIEYLYPLNTEKFSKKPLEEVEIRFELESDTPIKNLYSPTHDISPEWSGDNNVKGTYTEKNIRPDYDFRIFWTLSPKEVDATLVTHNPDDGEDGYFMFLASPEVGAGSREVIKKDVALVLDRSGSMSGEKIKQALGAAEFIVRNLNRGDKFNVIFYNDHIDPMWDKLKDYTSSNRKEVLARINKTEATGGTDIHGALTTAMKMIPEDGRPHYLIFLTDGLPTSGITDAGKITDAVKKANSHNTRLFAFGVGYDVNSILLDRLGADNHGLAEYVRPNENIEAKVSRFYSKIQSPALTDISLDFGDIRIRDAYPRTLPDLFRGEQLVYVGRYRDSGTEKITMKGAASDKKKTYRYKLDFASETDPEENSFIARLWAQNKIGWLIEQIRLHGEKKEYIDEIVRLSTRYGILTEYTAFLAEEEVELHAADNVTRAESNIKSRVKMATGAGGVAQSMQARKYQSAKQASKAAQYYDKSGEEVTVDRVKVLGSKTFYLKDGEWVDSEYKKDMKVKKVKQLSSPYFKLARSNTAQSKYLTFTRSRSIIVVMDGRAYRIEPVNPDK